MWGDRDALFATVRSVAVTLTGMNKGRKVTGGHEARGGRCDATCQRPKNSLAILVATLLWVRLGRRISVGIGKFALHRKC